MTTMAKVNVSREDAESLWIALRESFESLEKTLARIIRERAWIPLGYCNFAEAWMDRMTSVTLNSDLSRALVTYALLDSDGLPESEVRELLYGLPGIGPTRTDLILEQHGFGIPVEGVTTVRRHLRKQPSGPRVIRVELDESEYARFAEAAKAQGLDLTAEAVIAVRVRLAEIAAAGRA